LDNKTLKYFEGIATSRQLSVQTAFAVTGHIDLHLDELSRLRSVLRKLFERIAETAAEKRPMLISGLAEGADTVAAEVALEAGWFLQGALALPLDKLRDDYSAEGYTRLSSLLTSCHQIVEVSGARVSRPICYARLGQYLKYAASSLIAVWDGVDSDRAGGTAHTVAQFLRLNEADESLFGPAWKLAVEELALDLSLGIMVKMITPQRSVIQIACMRQGNSNR